MIQRRAFLSLVGGTAIARPVVARGQQTERIRRVGILMGGAADDSSESQVSMAAFVQELDQLGWTEGRNLKVDSLWAVGNASASLSCFGSAGAARLQVFRPSESASWFH